MKDDQKIFIGRRNGRVKIIRLSENDSSDETNVNFHTKTEHRIESIDFCHDTFITATLQKTLHWQLRYELEMPYLEPVAELGTCHKCVRLSLAADQVAMGKYKDTARKALRLVNLETYV